MTLITSISGIRGTIGGVTGENLTPQDIVKFTSAYGTWLKSQSKGKKRKVVIGRDGRVSGAIVSALVSNTLLSLGIDVIDLGLSTTPTVEMAVPGEKAQGGIILTASHNPKQWNALKLLNSKGEFVSAEDGATILELAEKNDFDFAEIGELGTYTLNDTYIDKHIEAILDLELVDAAAIKKKGYNVVVDGINSTGSLFVPRLLKALGVSKVSVLNEEVTGLFAHNPEPLEENLNGIQSAVEKENASLGIAVDPDVDRLCFICDDGSFFGEEYTLVSIADYVLQNKPGNTVSNLSSTRALKDVTLKHGGKYAGSAVGEVNVVKLMKETKAVIGGEGNGGVIYPELHYGRDALVGIALFLTYMAKSGKSSSNIRAQYPNYHISKNKIGLEEGVDVDAILGKMAGKYKSQPVNTVDGVKIEFDDNWVHLRKSNTEPIIRIYAESSSETTAETLARKIMEDIREFSNGKS